VTTEETLLSQNQEYTAWPLPLEEEVIFDVQAAEILSDMYSDSSTEYDTNEEADGPVVDESGYEPEVDSIRRQLLTNSSYPYPIPSLPYAPTIIFAVMSNCGASASTNITAMTSVIFNASAQPTGQSFLGWNNVCTHNQVLIEPSSILVVEVSQVLRMMMRQVHIIQVRVGGS
jgi:hypothetical protein